MPVTQPLIKFNEKAKLLYVTKQSGVGTPATAVDGSAVGVFDLTYSADVTSEDLNYTGDENNRTGFTPIEDIVVKLTGKTLMPVTGVPLEPGTTINQSNLFEIAGGIITTQGTETCTVTLPSLTNGQYVTIGGLTFTATASVTGADLAAVYAELIDGSAGGSGTATTEGAFTGALSGWTTGSNTGAVVVFTSSTANTEVGVIPTAKSNGVTLLVTETHPMLMISNEFLNTDVATLEFRMTSADISTDKVYQALDCIATLDLSIEVAKPVELMWNINGNYIDPSQETALAPEFGTQKNRGYLAPVMNAGTLLMCDFELEVDGVASAFTLGTHTVALTKLSASNLFGIDMTRYLTGVEKGFTKMAQPTDVMISIVAPPADADYVPEANRDAYHRVAVAVGTGLGLGTAFIVEFTQLQLVTIAPGTQGMLATQDLTFKNRGVVNLYWL